MNTSQATERALSTRRTSAHRTVSESGAVLTPERLEAFLERQRSRSTTEDTVKRYRHALELLYADLPPDKEIRRGTLARWRESLMARGYAARTINVSISAANSFLAYAGRREFQLMERLEPRPEIRPELTRSEYLRLLSTARALGKEQLYLLVKLFGSTGLPVQALPKVTVEAVQAGGVVLEQGGSRQSVHIPNCLRGELLRFARRTGRRAGPVFVTGGGTPLGRTNVSDGIRKLCGEAQVAEEKGNPRCLRRLYQTTRAGIEANISLLVEQAHDHLVEKEQELEGRFSDGDFLFNRILTVCISFAICFFIVFWGGYPPYTMLCILTVMFFRLSEAIADVLHGMDQKSWRLDIAGKSFLTRGCIMLFAFWTGEKVFHNFPLSIYLMAVGVYADILFYDVPTCKRHANLNLVVKKQNIMPLIKISIPLGLYSVLLNSIPVIPFTWEKTASAVMRIAERMTKNI